MCWVAKDVGVFSDSRKLDRTLLKVAATKSAGDPRLWVCIDELLG
jgi:hypothetical protein